MLQIEIRVEGRIDERWSEWLDGLTVAHAGGGPGGAGDETVLTGPIVDQAALYGLITKLRDLGLPLVSVQRVEPGRETRSGA
jgi:hypothetical protein